MPVDSGVRSRTFTTVPTRDGRVGFPTASSSESLEGLSFWQKMRYLASRAVFLIGIATTIMIVLALVAVCVCWCCEDRDENDADKLLEMAREDHTREAAQKRKIELQALEQKEKEKEARAAEAERVLLERRRCEQEALRRESEERRAKEAAEKLVADAKKRADAEVARRVSDEKRKVMGCNQLKSFEIVASKQVDETIEEFLAGELCKYRIEKAALTNAGAVVAFWLAGEKVKTVKTSYTERVKKDPMRGVKRVEYTLGSIDVGDSPWLLFCTAGKGFWIGRTKSTALFVEDDCVSLVDVCFGGTNDIHRAWCKFRQTESPIYSVSWGDARHGYRYFTSSDCVRQSELSEGIRGWFELQRASRLKINEEQIWKCQCKIRDAKERIVARKREIELITVYRKHEMELTQFRGFGGRYDEKFYAEIGALLKRLNVPNLNSKKNFIAVKKRLSEELAIAENMCEKLEKELAERVREHERIKEVRVPIPEQWREVVFEVGVVEDIPPNMRLGLNVVWLNRNL